MFVPGALRLLALADDRPWEVGSEAQRWRGYFYPETAVLRNVHDIRDPSLLAKVETALSENAALTYAPDQDFLTFDLDHLKGIHRHLFEDVYPWAGEIRTTTMHKGGADVPAFVEPDEIAPTMDGVAQYVASQDRFKGADLDGFRRQVQTLYFVVNNTHSFREGNGRSQRQWLSDLAKQAGFEVRWDAVRGDVNDRISQAARAGDHAPMKLMFEGIVHPRGKDDRTLPPAVRASFPDVPQRSTGPRPNPVAGRPTPAHERDRGYG